MAQKKLIPIAGAYPLRNFSRVLIKKYNIVSAADAYHKEIYGFPS